MAEEEDADAEARAARIPPGDASTLRGVAAAAPSDPGTTRSNHDAGAPDKPNGDICGRGTWAATEGGGEPLGLGVGGEAERPTAAAVAAAVAEGARGDMLGRNGGGGGGVHPGARGGDPPGEDEPPCCAWAWRDGPSPIGCSKGLGGSCACSIEAEAAEEETWRTLPAPGGVWMAWKDAGCLCTGTDGWVPAALPCGVGVAGAAVAAVATAPGENTAQDCECTCTWGWALGWGCCCCAGPSLLRARPAWGGVGVCPWTCTERMERGTEKGKPGEPSRPLPLPLPLLDAGEGVGWWCGAKKRGLALGDDVAVPGGDEFGDPPGVRVGVGVVPPGAAVAAEAAVWA